MPPPTTQDTLTTAPNTSGDLGSILSIWGHPDDEAYLAAGLMMQALESGHRVVCVTATRGEAGFPDDDPRTAAERMAIRETEMAKSLSIMGIAEHQWLGYGDGRCAEVPDEEAATVLAEIITDMRPDTVLTFGPDGRTGHPDHVAVCRWTTRAIELAALADTRLLYATATGRWVAEQFTDLDLSTVMMVEGLESEAVEESELAVWFRCRPDQLERKVAALRAQASQIEPFVAMVGAATFSGMWAEEFFRAPRPADADFIERARLFGSR